MKRLSWLRLVWTTLFTLALAVLSAQDTGWEQMLRLNRRFAAQLASEADYLRAADEYRKLAFHYASADSTLATADTLNYLAALCQRRFGDYTRSNDYLGSIRDRGPALGLESVLLQAANHYNLKQHDSSLASLSSWQGDPADARPNQLLRLDHLKLANLLETKRWTEAGEVAINLSGSDSLWFADLLARAESAPVKKPVLAALMSTVVPGSGKIYTGRTWDGVTSFILCLTGGWRAWEGFSDRGLKSIDGWLFGAVTAYFWVGNIYGSAVSARLYNERSQSDLRRELERLINEEN